MSFTLLRNRLVLLAALSLAGCPGRMNDDAGPDAGADAMTADVSADRVDTGTPIDVPDAARVDGGDAGTMVDAGKDVPVVDEGPDVSIADVTDVTADAAIDIVIVDVAPDVIVDTGTPVDTSTVVDAGTVDAGTVDAGVADVGTVDTGTVDAGEDSASDAPDASDSGVCSDGGGMLCGASCVDRLTDTNNCGTCGNVCTAGANSSAICVLGTCTLVCTGGFANCDTIASNGCEADLTSLTTCGTCSNSCASGANSTATCTAGTCGLTCAAGFGNCDGVASTGCEVDITTLTNCGTCGTTCASGANSTATCTAGSCGLSCATGFANCDSMAATGCEVDLSAPATCGTCTNACVAPANSTTTCAAGTCGFACVAGFANCDSMSGNGCETSTASDIANCGTCGMVCAPAANAIASCTSGTCGISCNTGFANCDASASNGCERNTVTDAANCGACGTACPAVPNATAVCAASTCGFTCATGFGNCDGNNANGCETNTNFATANCGACGVACTSGQVCNSGVCAAATCSLPITGTLTLPAPGAPALVTSGTTSGASMIASAGCQSNSAGPEHIYSFTVTQLTRVTFDTATPPAGTTLLDTVLSIRRNCATQASEVACNDDIVSGMPLSRVTATLDPGNYFIVVDGYNGQAGAYNLAATTSAVAPNGVCSAATTLTPGTPITAQNSAQGGASSAACLTSATGGQLFYSLTIPANQRAAITATPTGTSPTWRPTVRVLDTCTSTSCLASQSATADGAASSVSFDNRTATARTVIVSVSAGSNTATGTFNLNATLTALPPLAINSVCATATVVTDGTTIIGENTLASATVITTCSSSFTGPVLFYSIILPAGQTLRVTATPAGGSAVDPVLRVLSSCSGSCLAQHNTTGAGVAETVQYANTAVLPATVIVALGTTTPATAGTMDIAFSISTPPGSACATAPMLTSPASIQGDLVGGVDQRTGTGCGSNSSRVVYRSIDVQAGELLRASVTSDGTWDPIIRIIATCASTTCLANANAFSANAAPETVSATNTGATTVTYLIAVSAASSSVLEGGFTLTAFTTPNPPAGTYSSSSMAAACIDISSAPALATPFVSTFADDNATNVLALPFAFSFFGVPVGSYSMSSNGFAQVYPGIAGRPALTFGNLAIPTASVPDGLLAPMWDDLYPRGAGSVGVMRSATVGTAPNRTFVMEWSGWDVTGATAPSPQRFQVQLAETSGVVGYHYCAINTVTDSNGAAATVGLEDLTGSRGIQTSFNVGMLTTGGGFRYTPM